MTVVAVILTFNRREQLRSLLDRLPELEVGPDHVLVVDNGSTDGTFDVATRAAAGSPIPTTVIRARRNGGSAEGYHAALDWCRQSGFEWAWLVEDDLIPAPDALRRLLEHDAVGDDSTSALVSAVHDANGHPLLVPRGRLRRRFFGTPCIPIAVDEYGSGSVRLQYFGFLGSLVRLSMIDRSGLPRRDMLGWIDDVDFSSRLARVGAAWLVPGSVVVHDDGTTADDFGSGFLDRVRRLRSEPPVETMWRNAYGLRNLLIWGRRSGLVRRRHAITYVALLAFRAVAVAPNRRVLRARIYVRMGRDGWRGTIRNVAPQTWPLITEYRGSVDSFLNRYRMAYDESALLEERPTPRADAPDATTGQVRN